MGQFEVGRKPTLIICSLKKLRGVKSPTLKWDLPIPGVKLFQMCKRAFGHNISSGKEGPKIHLSGIVVIT